MNSLEGVWSSYRVTRRSIRVVERVIDLGAEELLGGIDFATQTLGDLASGMRDADDLYVLALWAVFERNLRDYLETEGPRPLETGDSPLHLRLSAKVRREMAYWRNDDVLDLFKGVVDPFLIGHAKQIKQYRDWVAHRNPKRLPPASVTPRNAYKTLAEILAAMDGVEGDAVG